MSTSQKVHTPYHEKLKDPRWQKKRLEIMQRDEFKCRHCGDKDKTLNVHHAYYEKGKAPWEYSDEMLTTLCEECHAFLTVFLNDVALFMADSKLNRSRMAVAMLIYGGKTKSRLSAEQADFIERVGPVLRASLDSFVTKLTDLNPS